MPTNKRERLIDTALELFNRHGFNATGIDKILAEAGVAKMTLYKHFRSKDDLIAAVLRKRDTEFRQWLMDYVERNAATPRDKLLALFDAHRDWFAGPGFRGCLFQNASAEFAGTAEPISTIPEEHGRLVHTYIRGLASAAGAGHPDRLADWFILLLDGAISCAQITASPSWAASARDAAEILLDSELNRGADESASMTCPEPHRQPNS